MSRKSEAKRSIYLANAKSGGARVTKAQAKLINDRFVDWCFQNNYIFNSLTEITLEMVRAYFKSIQEEGVSTATQHNRLSAIRRAMKALSCDPDTKRITAKALELKPRSRAGTKLPIRDDEFHSVICRASELQEPGFVLALKLQRYLGLRGLESLMVVSTLEKYALDANQLITNGIPISDGTKGGRPRVTMVIHKYALETLQTIHEALLYMKQNNGFLIEAGNNGLKSAVSKYHRLAKQVGLVGKQAPHSLRYAFCVDKLTEFRDAGLNRKEAAILVANYLGHGDSRARYVSIVYGQEIIHTLPIEKRKSRIERAIQNLKKLFEDLDKDMGQTGNPQFE